MSGSSNGKAPEPSPPPISRSVQELLDKQRECRYVDDAIEERLTTAVTELTAAFPNHGDRIVRKLEGIADRIRKEEEAQKLKQRHRDR